MRVIVCVDAALDAGMPMRPAADGRTLLQGLSAEAGSPSAAGESSHWIGTAARAAVELALAVPAREVIAVSVGGSETRNVLAWCLARGVARAVQVDSGGPVWTLDRIARDLASVAREFSPDLVLCGNAGERQASGAVGQGLAEALGWPYLDAVLTMDAAEGALRAIQRRSGGWRDEVAVALPAVLACDFAAMPTRYVSWRAQHMARAADIPCIRTSTAPPEPDVVFEPARSGLMKAPAASNTKAHDRIRAVLGGGAKKPAGPAIQEGVDRQVSAFIDLVREHAILD